jgi:hypothetical protein
MKKMLIAATFVLFSAPAFAGQCPVDMKKIDAALANASLSTAQLAEVTALRTEGESQHKSGDHGDSVATLAKAKAILGIN